VNEDGNKMTTTQVTILSGGNTVTNRGIDPGEKKNDDKDRASRKSDFQ